MTYAQAANCCRIRAIRIFAAVWNWQRLNIAQGFIHGGSVVCLRCGQAAFFRKSRSRSLFKWLESERPSPLARAFARFSIVRFKVMEKTTVDLLPRLGCFGLISSAVAFITTG